MPRSLSSLLATLVIALAGAAPALAASCDELAARLATLDRRGGSPTATAAAQQRSELARAEAFAARCALSTSTACAALPRRLAEMRSNLARLETAARRGAVARAADRQRAGLVAAMQRQGCGRAAPVAARPAAPPSGGLLAFLGFTPARPLPELITRGPPPTIAREGPAERALRRRIEAPDAMPQHGFAGFGRGPFRTLCVRSCDGYFWPVSYAVSRAAFERDEAVCRAACPNHEVALYVHRNPGGTSAQAISLHGQPYAELPNADLFRRRYEPSCQCRPATPVPDAEPAALSYTPVPTAASTAAARRAEAPLVVSTARDHTSDRATGEEGLRGVYPARAGPLTPRGPEDAPAPSPDRSEEEAP
jgi:hypothetical protein